MKEGVCQLLLTHPPLVHPYDIGRIHLAVKDLDALGCFMLPSAMVDVSEHYCFNALPSEFFILQLCT